ncbi:PIG-L family deacetylase [Gryllotalpicola protaetiae]|uniref:LmbE-like protein n=1 Tax=Gryllotalpicola protaetiae TaxID=2419771 RepID=A0A387BMB4_9MICO|nr:PIG-L family deacetylase [Gryllotalpicola protaetiae]AYG03532.1 LmbE-like protein [Gryllotalpicola protaetiae]
MALPPLFAGVRRALFFHAHPDDESLTTGGLIALLADAGVKVRVVTCTRGERGEVVPGPLKWLEGTPELADHRAGELARALRELGADPPVLLGSPRARAFYLGPGFRYVDSGMAWGADGRATAAADAPDRVGVQKFSSNGFAVGDGRAAVRRFKPDVVVGYDVGGGYGHPDHVWAHVVAKLAAARHGVPFVEVAPAEASDAVAIAIDLTVKRRALAAHATQLTLTDDGYVLSGGQHHVLEAVERYRVSPAGPATRR